MLGVTANFMDSFTNFFESKADPRTSNWFLAKNPVPLLTILITYVYFCRYAGPRYMRDKKPYDLKNTIIFYNFAQIIISTYLFYESLAAGWMTYYNYSCQPVDYSDTPKALRMARGTWLYFMCKIIELLDTVFFVFRKKMNQVSYLHMYHHTIMPICAWIGVTYLPGGHGTLLGCINCFIHIIMYGYYLISSLGPQYQRYLWWKRHLTTLQIIQFGIIFIHNFQVMFRECDYPKFINFLLFTQALYFTYMFSKFYIKTYILRQGKENKVEAGASGKVKSK